MVNRRNLCFYGLGKGLDRLKVIHVELHHLDGRSTVVLPYRGVIEEGGFAIFTFDDVADGKDQCRGVEGEKLAGCLQAHAGAGARDDDGLAMQVDARGQRGDFGLGEDTHGANKGCQLDWG